jgi:hypothetical protein
MEEFSDPDPRIRDYQRDTTVGKMLLWTVLQALIFAADGEYEEDFQPWGDTCSLRVEDVSISMFDCSAWRESQLVVTDWSTLSLDDPDGLVQYTLTAGSEADNADLEHAPDHAFMM